MTESPRARQNPPAFDLMNENSYRGAGVDPSTGLARTLAASRSTTAHPLHTRFVNTHLVYGASIFLKRQCDRTLGRPRGLAGALQPPALRRDDARRGAPRVYIRLSLFSTAQPIYPSFPIIFGSRFSKVTIGYHPRRACSSARGSRWARPRTPGTTAGSAIGH